MSIRSVELKNSAVAAARKRLDWPLLLGKIGVWLALASFGGIFWAINGGFSVIGLEVLATSFNHAGACSGPRWPRSPFRSRSACRRCPPPSLYCLLSS